MKTQYPTTIILFFIIFMPFLGSCEILDDDPEIHTEAGDSTSVALDEVARILAAVPLESIHMQEVHNAVASSSCNGYDEEYTLKDMFSYPGAGVGDVGNTRNPRNFDNPLRDLITDYVRTFDQTRAAAEDSLSFSPEEFLKALEESDIQIYWPFSDTWDGEGWPVITYDPEDGSTANIGFEVSVKDDGSRHVMEVIVDEEMAKERPVWVVNRNSDAGYMSLEMLRREDPDWGEGGGTIIVKPCSARSGEHSLRTLVLKDFTMHRNYDSWFAGASEFFVKIGSVEDFTATTEAELLLYNPVITDFMIVVKRNQVGIPQPFNAVLVSEWTDQLTHCALMITEDDGGTQTSWDCSAIVKINSKSYGFDISIPFRKRDDIVWRGQLTSRWIEANNNLVGRFGDLDLTFEVLEY